jgi:flagellar biosynthesis/type III secretory pathway protein FliH
MLWIVSAGRPRKALKQLGFRPLRRSPSGVFDAAPGFKLRLVVLSSLPRTRRTLVLRLLGAGRTFLGALQEVRVLPSDAWEVRLARPWLVRYQLEIKSLDPRERTAEEEAIMGAQELYEEWEREVLQRGKALGLDEGKAIGLDEGKAIGLDEGKAIGLDEGKAIGLDEGKAIGLDEGKAIGLDEGKRQLLLRVLAARFPGLPDWVEERIHIAHERHLDQWAERAATADCLEDVFET